ncbi:hypothetical protein REPUB_Repub18cG0036100 [Reevesia pubescens]
MRNVAGYGMVIRDFASLVLATDIKRQDYIFSSMHAEVSAILFGLQIALEHGVTKVQTESDSLLAIHGYSRHDSSF